MTQTKDYQELIKSTLEEMLQLPVSIFTAFRLHQYVWHK